MFLLEKKNSNKFTLKKKYISCFNKFNIKKFTLIIFLGIETSFDRVMHVPLILLYLDRYNKLMPLAIQLTRMTQYPNQIYTPLDRSEVWTFAKMHVALADSLVHQMVRKFIEISLYVRFITCVFRIWLLNQSLLLFTGNYPVRILS